MRRWLSILSRRSDGVTPAWSQAGLSLQLIGLLCLAAVHSFYIPIWSGAVLALCVGWRWLVSHGRLRLPPVWLLLPLAFGGIAVVFAVLGTLLGAEAGSAFVMWLAGCKLLETRTPRDAASLSLLGLFLSFTLLLHDQDLLMAGVVAVLLWLFLWSIAADRLGTATRRLGRSAAGTLLLQAAPLALILFLVFPRIPGPLWRLPETRPQFRTGVSPTLAPGSVANLAQSQEVAFRARFLGARPQNDALYWRGPVMSRFDGYAWQPGPERLARRTPDLPAAADYELTLEPHPFAWVYALEHAVGLPDGARRLRDGQIVAETPIRQRQRFRLQSSATGVLPLPLSAEERGELLRLPEDANPRSRAWGEELQRRHPDPEQRVAAVLRRFREEGYRYTLQPPTLPRDWIDAFLFRTRLGFCEHFAGSSAFVLRAAGVPTRVVGGYMGAEPNPMGDYLIVRQSAAHAWIEVWLDRRGWVRVDPTSEAAPGRREGLEQALPAEEAVRVADGNAPWLRQARYLWDNGQNQWNQWVIGYDEQNRQALLKKIGGGQPAERIAILLAMTGLLLSAASVWFWLWRRQRRGRPRPAPEQREWLELERWLRRRGHVRRPGEGPRDFLNRVRALEPERAETLRRFGELYLRLRYGRPEATDTAAGLRHLRRSLRRPEGDAHER